MIYGKESDINKERWDENFKSYVSWVNSHNGKFPTNSSTDEKERFLYNWMKANKSRYLNGKLEQRRANLIVNFNPSILRKTHRKPRTKLTDEQKLEQELLTNKGLTQQQIEDLNKLGIESMSDVIKALRRCYWFSIKERATSLHPKERAVYSSYLNAFKFLKQYRSEPYPNEFIYSLFKRRSDCIKFGTALTLTAIADGNIERILFSSEYNWDGINIRTERALYNPSLSSEEHRVMLFKYFNATPDNKPTQKDTARKLRIGFAKIEQLELSALNKLRRPEVLMGIKKFDNEW